MSVKLVLGGACENIILPCSRDTFYADANSCGYYYRCQGYQVWRNKCPDGTASMGRGTVPCGGMSWQCDANNPQARCARNRESETEDDDNCILKFSLPCKNETSFLDPVTCGHYLTCQNREKGHVLGRKACGPSARCHLMKHNQYCQSAGQPKCHKKGTVVVVGEPDDGGTTTTGEVGVNHTALIVGLVMATIISILILGFLVIIFYRRKQKRKRRPCLPALTVSAPIPLNAPCSSVRYSQVDRPISILTYSEPNNYSVVSDSNGAQGPELCKGDSYQITSDTSGVYEEIDDYQGGFACPGYSSTNDAFDQFGDTIHLTPDAGDNVPRRPTGKKPPRPHSEEWRVARGTPVRRPTRPFSLTTHAAPRPPLEPPRDSCASLNVPGYSHPYFILPSNRAIDHPSSPTSPDQPHKYFVLEKGARDMDVDTISLGTTYCEIDESHFLQEQNRKPYLSFV